MSLGNFALFCSHAAGLGAQFQHLLLVLLVSCCHTADSGKTWPLMPLLWFAQVAASIAVPLWQNILLRIGKKATVFIGMSVRARPWATSAFSVFYPILTDLSFSQLFIPAVATVACFPSNLPVFMLMCILMGFSVATMFLLPWWVIFQPRHRVRSPIWGSCRLQSGSRLSVVRNESFTWPLPNLARDEF